ncbi:unnamed protein product [Fraxinus pennsylvanica]|uniref:Uncharacterized protein n=1 Tax=Fraxinus pennsylvanica TaxID=56036 RepID=A0AAD2ABL7_9LAMI|nr:unnamed protein product [Fraxinus pennsylvanica]
MTTSRFGSPRSASATEMARARKASCQDPTGQEIWIWIRVECVPSTCATIGVGFRRVERGILVQPLFRAGQWLNRDSRTIRFIVGGAGYRKRSYKLPFTFYSSDSSLFCGCSFCIVFEV